MKTALGEVDYADKVLVRPSVHSERDQWCWVKIRRGNKHKGTGALMHVTKEMSAKGCKPGDVIFFINGSFRKAPRFVRKAKVRNQLKNLVSQINSNVETLKAVVVPEKPVTIQTIQVSQKQAAASALKLRPLLAAELKSCMTFNPAPNRRPHLDEAPRLRIWNPAHHNK